MTSGTEQPPPPGGPRDRVGAAPGLGQQGFPPGIDLANWQTAPNQHWTFQNVAGFLPTARIFRGAGPVADLPAAPSPLDAVVVPLPALGGPRTVGQIMAATETDGWMVVHRGLTVTEQYFGTMTADTSHLLMSVSKTLVAAVVGALSDAGTLDVDTAVTAYVPALAGTGYAGATVRHLLDMRSGIAFSEDYLDPQAEVRLLEEAIGWAPRRNPAGPATMYDFLLTLQQKSAHGGPFNYRSCETDVLGWVCEAAAGTPMPVLLSELVWSRIGAQADATIGVDPVGTGMFDGGINAGLRDLARFGSLFLRDGVSLTGQPVVSPAWIADTLAGGPDSRAAFAASPDAAVMPGGMYRNQCWFPYPGSNVMLCLGIHGQMIYINQAAQLVAVKLSSWPYPQDAYRLFSTIQAFDAIAAALG
ncbi:beta-lactamase family protein [Arthrobacter sp. I2-34]|uniref:Beta-lactamase family protein n=1 Tax=Arthrobacter hankyongi TaxID=2904801 RepID=A0ABS9L815_9MICC|nr:serine hydrolase [Arthrobacter hankyongi]MCG2622812.1 beta-lactamase family protein [Arthrobacter hankyongi]